MTSFAQGTFTDTEGIKWLIGAAHSTLPVQYATRVTDSKAFYLTAYADGTSPLAELEEIIPVIRKRLFRETNYIIPESILYDKVNDVIGIVHELYNESLLSFIKNLGTNTYNSSTDVSLDNLHYIHRIISLLSSFAQSIEHLQDDFMLILNPLEIALDDLDNVSTITPWVSAIMEYMVIRDDRPCVHTFKSSKRFVSYYAKQDKPEIPATNRDIATLYIILRLIFNDNTIKTRLNPTNKTKPFTEVADCITRLPKYDSIKLFNIIESLYLIPVGIIKN